MSLFEKTVAVILDHEGGFVNDPSDRGGATNFGITIDTLKRYRGKAVSVSDVKNLKIEEAKAIYKKFYWDAMKLDFCESEELALLLFDQGVLRGTTTAIKSLQKAIGVTDDGNFGSGSIKRLRAIGERQAVKRFLQLAFIAYAKICVSNPTQLKFLVGWCNRVNSLWDQCLKV